MTKGTPSEKRTRSREREAEPIKRSSGRKDATPEWTVSYGSAGPPGWLAYLLELHIRAGLQKSWPSRPKHLSFQSSTQLCRTLGLRTALPGEHFKKALQQLIEVGVTRKKHTVDHGVSHDQTTSFQRYEGSVTIGLLEDPKEATLDINLLDPVFKYWNECEFLPLNTDHYQKLPPGPRALYEWLSYRLYAAALEGCPAGTIGYSDFCRYASQPRQRAIEEVRAQMEALHQPHVQSGYLAGVTYEVFRTRMACRTGL